MIFVFYAVILILVLILIRDSFEKLHTLIAIIFFFILLHFLLSMLVIPFIEKLLSYVHSVPYISQLVYSALFYQIGSLIHSMFEEQEYEAIGELVMIAVRIVLLTYWIGEFADVLSKFSSILEKLQ
ncbi:hypothetical protein CD30_05370 [Ureibacillus massiliensis 4400831 = CIP 108448 = CCUG 49529]|uniref:Stage III sporulation protein AD n=1 Tax=Ureibacillus massiliensis 4400831 = CIP 108448 = CCUG 49529 TaxID=1211035 RepID=A0A0A3J3I0_9BACL|nr:hypothetical protein [Ureibacillus massiliensis]KGR91486.1 hypothetical protein CD30_05370 [Ureibacillus massiliensis 4400831 = CIP 108448 = CCUG 49529]